MPEGLSWTLSPLPNYFMVFIYFFISRMGSMWRGHHYWVIFRHEVGWPLGDIFICFRPLSSFVRNHCTGPQVRISILKRWYPHHGAYEWDYLWPWPPFDPVSPSGASGQGVEMEALESIRVISGYKYFSGMHFGHRWLTHFGCANGFSRLCHTFFGWSFISRHGAYQWSFFPGRRLGCFGYFVLMFNSSTLLFHTDNTSFFLPIFFGGFW